MSCSAQCWGVTEDRWRRIGQMILILLRSQLYRILSLSVHRNCIMGEAPRIGTWNHKFVYFCRFLTSYFTSRMKLTNKRNWFFGEKVEDPESLCLSSIADVLSWKLICNIQRLADMACLPLWDNVTILSTTCDLQQKLLVIWHYDS